MKLPHIIIIALSLAGCISAPPAQAQSIVPHHIVVRHPGVADNAPQSYTLSQALDQRGHPIGYSMVVDSVVCTDSLCKVVKVTMTWDALGIYQSYALAYGTVLEKAQAADPNTSPKSKAWTAFTQADHAKLHRILRDSSSVLRTQRIADLTGYLDKSRVDGVTGATPLTLREAVVEGASLSSYHLWHWANGEVAAAARELTHLSYSAELLRDFLNRDEPHYVLFALDHLRRHKLFSPPFVSAVIQVMSDGDPDRIDLGLAYLRSAMPDKDAFYDQVADLFTESNGDGRIYLLGLLDDEQEISGAHLNKMSLGLKDTDTYYEIHLFLSLVEKHKHVSEQILNQTSLLLESENFFVARRAYWHLEKQTLNEQLTRRIEVFAVQIKSYTDGSYPKTNEHGESVIK
jgi:hypothetical protein